jgi:DNA-binding MarR family transcriptional regulator
LTKTTLSVSNLALLALMDQLSHSIYLLWRKELTQYNILVRQSLILRVLQDLGSNATIGEVAKIVKRKGEVISRQVISMEKDGLLKRTRSKPKSNLLTLELTEKGLEMANISRKSELIDKVFSCITKEDRRQMELVLNKLIIKAKKINADLD